MDDIDLKISILKKSMSTFSGWLDQCEELIGALPTQLEQCDHAHLRELAMKYKDLLLQMKERCDYMQEVNNLCKEIGDSTASKPHPSSPAPTNSSDDKSAAPGPPASPTLNPRLAELATQVKDLNTRFATTCVQARQHYASLSKTMATALQDRPVSLHSFSFSLSSPKPDRKELWRTSGSFDEAPGNHHSKHRHKKSKGHKAKRRDRLSLSLDPQDGDESFSHPLSKSTRPRIKSMNLSSSPPTDSLEETDVETSVSLKGLGLSTSAGVTDLDGFAWGGGGGRQDTNVDSCSVASVDSTFIPSSATTHPPLSSYGYGANLAARRLFYARTNSESGATAVTLDTSAGAAVLRRRVSLPEDELSRRRSCSALQFVQELGLVQIKEEGTRGLRPRSAVLLSDSEQDLNAAVQAAMSTGSGQKALLSKAMKRGSTELSDRVKSSSSMTLHTLSETDTVPAESFANGTPTGKGVNFPLLVSTKSGSLCDLPARTRFSFTSVDNLDPRPILGGGDLNSELARIASSERTNSVEALNCVRVLPEATTNINGHSGIVFKAPPPSSALLTPGRLDPRKSRSMDVLSPTGPPPRVSLTTKLGELSNQLQEFVHNIAEGKHCALQSLALELKLGEIKAMLTILEVQDLELLRLRALYSPDDQHRLEAREKERKGRLSPTRKDHAVSYPVQEVKGKKEEIEKLTQRIGLLRNHCEESIQQMEEVLEFVTQFEGEIKMLRDFLTAQTSQVEAAKKKEESFSEETWSHLQLALTEINEHKERLQSVQELSTHLLYLEPIFDGKPVCDDLRMLSNHFQNLVMEVFSLLEAQAKNRTDQVLLEVSVLSSWVTETELAVQALAKKTKKPSGIVSKLITTKETLDQDLRRKQESLLTITEKIQPLKAVLSPDDSAALRDLISQVDSHTKSMLQLENSLQVIELDLKEHDPSRGTKAKVEDKLNGSIRSTNNSGRLQDSGRYQIGGANLQNGVKNSKNSELDDNDGNYAEIDALREQILKSRSKVPAPGLVSGSTGQKSSGQASNESGAQSNGPVNVSRLHPMSAVPIAAQSPSAVPPALYERVEEILPSPFADYDLVPSRSLDTAIEQLPRQLGPKVTLSHTQSHYDSPSSSYYQSPRSSQSHSPSPSLTTPTPQYYQVPTSLLRQNHHHHSLSTPSPLPTPPPSASQASQSPPNSQTRKSRYVEIDVFPENDSSLVIKKSSSAGSVERLEGASTSPHATRGKAGVDQPDSSEGEKPEKPPRSHYHGGEGESEGGKVEKRRKKKRRSERGSLHEELLEFISQEWASLDLAEMSTQSSAEEEARLDEAISCLESYELRSSCVKFVNGIRDLETSVKGAKEQISLIRTPRVPDLEQVHGYIDQCQKLKDRISTLHPRLEAFNEESLQLVTSLGRAPSCSRVAQLLEIRLFDVSTLWHSANMKVATCMRELRQREGEINTLYRQLRTISRALDEARGLLEKKQSVLCVDDYLNQCKEMQMKLGSLSEVRVQVTSNIKGSILHSPQLPVCQNLLDQLKQVDGQWVNIIKELSDIAQLEPILIKKMFINISNDFASTENMLKELVKQRALKLTDALENCKVCQDHLQKLKKFRTTLNKTDGRLITIIETSAQNDQDSYDDGMELSGVRRSGSGTGPSLSMSSGVVENGNGTGIQVELVITQYGPELASVNHKELLKICKALLQRTEELLSEVEALASNLQNESDLLGRFYKDLEDLQLWTSDTKSMLGSGSHSNGVATSAQPLTSVAQLRGKHQAICQQVATRQPKMETVQTLASEVLKLPSAQAGKQEIKKQLTELFNDWDDICQQCVPAGALPKVATPTGPGGSLAQFLSTPDFEDETQMIEWMILVESRIQPQQITVGDFRQLRRQQRELQMIESELKSREKDYQHFMKGFRESTLSISQCSDIVDPESSVSSKMATQPNSLSPAAESLSALNLKSVKFSDENTLQRFQRHQDIGNGINFSDSGSKSSESDLNTSLPDSVKDMPMLAGPGAIGVTNGGSSGRPYLWRTNSGRYHHMGPESNLNGLHHHTSTPIIGLGGASQTSLGTPGSPVPDDIYQLAILWKGIWSGLLQQKKRLEAIQEAWKAFEDKKEVFVNFLTKGEERLQSVFKVLSTTKDVAVMNAEFGAYLSFSNEMQTHSQCLTNLNEMSRDLLDNHHSNDDTHDLQDTMNDLNLRWKKLMQSYTQHQPTITALHTRWLEFFRDYQSFLQWLRTMDLDMSNLNPFVKDMDAVKTQLEKLKEIQQELHVKEGVVESIRLHAHKLLQGLGGNHINSAAIHGRLDNMGRRWDHLQTLAADRKTALEQALSEKQDFLSRLADVLAWLNQAEKHLAAQKPLGTDYYTVHTQYQAQQGFWLEVTEQRSKVEAVLKSGRQIAMETHWPQGTGESLRSQYSGLEERWRKLWSEGEQWGQLLQTVHPELEKFQTLCTECGQKLSDAELKMVKQEPVAKKMTILEQQYEALQQFENALLIIGDILEALVMSQKHQLQLSVKVSPELIQLVKRFHQRWNELKQKVEGRHSAIDRAMVKYDPVNLGVAELPYGWQRSTTENGTPYYINTRVHNSAQWHHPELSELYSKLKTEHTLSSYPSSAYPIALKLRAIQKRAQLNLLKTHHTMSIYSDHFTKVHGSGLLDHPIPPYDATCLAVDMFQKVEETDMAQSATAMAAHPMGFYLNSAVELSTCYLRDVFDIAHAGSINCLSYHIGIICMSAGKLDEKYRALFALMSNGQSGIDMEQLTLFLEQVVQIPQSVCETQFCTLRAIDVCARECFRKYVGVGKLQMPQFVSWLQTEPPPLSWLPILHRLAAAEKAHHPVKCSICKDYPITGFRYRCVQCSGFDMCQTCYWSGKTGKNHDRSKHFMEEYCIPQKTSDNVFKTLQRSFRQKKNKSASQTNKKQPQQQQQQQPAAGRQRSNASNAPAPKVGGDNHPVLPTIRKAANASPSTGVRHSAYVALTIGESPSYPPTINSSVDDEAHPGRRFTVTEDMKTAWQRGGAGGGTKVRSKVESSPPPPPIPARSSSANDTTVQPMTSTPVKGKQYNLQRPPMASQARGSGNMDASLSQLTEKNRNLSKRLSSLRERRSSSTSSSGNTLTRTHASLRDQTKDHTHPPTTANTSLPTAAGVTGTNTAEVLSVEEQLRKRNAYLQGRVDTLQEQNKQLGQCITDLRSFTDMQRQQQFARVSPRNISPNPYLLPTQNGGPPSLAGVHHHHHHSYHQPNRHSMYTPSYPTTTASSSHNPLNPSVQSNHVLTHGMPPQHHFHQVHNLHQHHHPHQPLQTHGTNYGRTSPIPPPSKFIQPATVPHRSTSPVSQLAPTSYPRPGSRSPPPVSGRVSPNSQSRGGHTQSRHQTQL